MADEKAKFRAALEEVRSGSPDAIWKFIEEYGPAIQRIARRSLDPRVQSKFDSVDFVQMVWASFFRNPRKIRSFHRPEDIFRYLGRMIRNKVCDEHRRCIVTAKHDVTRERPLQPSDLPADRVDLTPSQVAIAKEEWERMIDGKPERDQQVARLRLGGATIAEISQKLKIHEKTVRRTITRLLEAFKADRDH